MSKKKDPEEISEGPRIVPAPGPSRAPRPRKGPPESWPVREAAGFRYFGAGRGIADLNDELLSPARPSSRISQEDAPRTRRCRAICQCITFDRHQRWTDDDFERAIRSAAESADFGTFLQGISMIEKPVWWRCWKHRWGLNVLR